MNAEEIISDIQKYIHDQRLEEFVADNYMNFSVHDWEVEVESIVDATTDDDSIKEEVVVEVMDSTYRQMRIEIDEIDKTGLELIPHAESVDVSVRDVPSDGATYDDLKKYLLNLKSVVTIQSVFESAQCDIEYRTNSELDSLSL